MSPTKLASSLLVLTTRAQKVPLLETLSVATIQCSLPVNNKKKTTFREQATTDLAAFHACPPFGRIGFWRIHFCGGRKTTKPGETPLDPPDQNQTSVTLVGGMRSHHCADFALHLSVK